MSRSFRPVIERHGPHSSCFIDSEDVEIILSQLADNAGGCLYDSRPDGECTRVQLTNGVAFLNYLESMNAAVLVDQLISNYDGVRGFAVDDLLSLLQNLRALAPDWRPFVDTDGDFISFLID